MTSVEPLLTPIRERVEAATPGPWFASRYYVGSGEDPCDPDAEIAKAGSKADAAFIASAPTDMARLLAAVEAVLAQAEACDEMATITPEETAAAALRMAARGIRFAIATALGGDK